MLAGKRIIVTGAATGIGRATARRVAEHGATVAAFDINDDDGRALAEGLTAEGATIRYWHVDVSDEGQVRSAVEAATAWFGDAPDVLLHIAGVLRGARVDLVDFDEATWDAVIDINLKGSFLMAKQVVPHMRRAGRGVIVLTASGAGVTLPSSSYAYGASKGGVHGLAMVLRGSPDLAGIRVIDVAPGNVTTPLKLDAIEAIYRRTGNRVAYEADLAGLIAPEGVANLMAWLASDEADAVTGTIFTR